MDDKTGVMLLYGGRRLRTEQFNTANGLNLPTPHVSSLMVTQKRPHSAMRAVECFLAQSYTHADLVIIDDDIDDLLERRIAQLPHAERSRVSYHRQAPENRSLGSLRNLAVARARGPLVSQWDDDDIYHPDRLRHQVAALLQTGAAACSLWRHQMLWTQSRRMCLSRRRIWEGSLVAFKSALPPYPDVRRSEDLAVTEALIHSGYFCLLDAPELYTYIVHGNNTFDAPHFEAHWQCATRRFSGPSFCRQLRRTARDMPMPVKRYLLDEVAPETRRAAK